MATTTTTREQRERVSAEREAAYNRGVEAGKKQAAPESKKGEEKKGFITTLLDDLISAIDRSDEEKKKQLTAITKTPTRETVVAAFDAANDVTAGATAAYRANRVGNTARAHELQSAAEREFLALDPLVREGALMVLYVRAEAEYAANQAQTAHYQTTSR